MHTHLLALFTSALHAMIDVTSSIEEPINRIREQVMTTLAPTDASAVAGDAAEKRRHDQQIRARNDDVSTQQADHTEFGARTASSRPTNHDLLRRRQQNRDATVTSRLEVQNLQTSPIPEMVTFLLREPNSRTPSGSEDSHERKQLPKNRIPSSYRRQDIRSRQNRLARSQVTSLDVPCATCSVTSAPAHNFTVQIVYETGTNFFYMSVNRKYAKSPRQAVRKRFN